MKRHNGIEYTHISTYEEIEVSLISPSTTQLRSELGNVDELVSSISSNGLIEPIVLRPKENRFEIIAGNRRFLACKKLNFRRIPSVVLELSDQQAYEAALVENIQRKTLDPLQEAECFQRYCDDFGWGSESQLALKIGKSQEYVSHRIKLLSLPESVKTALKSGSVSLAVAEEISWIRSADDQEEVMSVVAENGLNREQTRYLARTIKSSQGENVNGGPADWPPRDRDIEQSADASVSNQAILVLRISLVRIDALIEKASSKALKRSLLDKRIVIHSLIDELISYKKTLL